MPEENKNKREFARPKHELLKDFIRIMHKHDPIGVQSPDENEYEAEALSILARLCEIQVHLAEDEDSAIEATNSIVVQTFEFWYDEAGKDNDYNDLSIELLHTYVTSFPEPQPGDLPKEDEPVHVVVRDEAESEEPPIVEHVEID